MSDEIVSWRRPHLQAGGGDAYLFYAIYGPTPAKSSVSKSKYRCTGLPKGLEIMGYGPGNHPEVLDEFRGEFYWQELVRTNKQLSDIIQQQSQCVWIRGLITDPADLNYFRDVVGLIEWLHDSGCVATFDATTFRWWSASEWHTGAFEATAGDLRHHVEIYVSPEDDGKWFHTRGMTKFGRPDLSIHNVRLAEEPAVIDMLNRFIELQALGGIVDEGYEIGMASLPEGMTCHHGGDVDDPDFNNAHIEIRWPD